MGEHETWFHLLPGLKNLEAAVGHQLGATWVGGEEIHGLPHVVMAIFTFVLIVYVGMRYHARLQAAPDKGIVPESEINARSFVEVIADAAMGVMSGIMGRTAAKQFLPLIGTLAIFILISNLLGLLPGFLPSTDTLSTTAACASVVFVTTHVYGLKKHGIPYLKHFLGPVIWLAPLMLPIELVSHAVRPISLSLRLMGNMLGDHKVLGIFLGLVPLVLPIPIMILGIVVCIVQTLVFCMLSTVYIGLAIEEHEGH